MFHTPKQGRILEQDKGTQPEVTGISSVKKPKKPAKKSKSYWDSTRIELIRSKLPDSVHATRGNIRRADRTNRSSPIRTSSPPGTTDSTPPQLVNKRPVAFVITNTPVAQQATSPFVGSGLRRSPRLNSTPVQVADTTRVISTAEKSITNEQDISNTTSASCVSTDSANNSNQSNIDVQSEQNISRDLQDNLVVQQALNDSSTVAETEVVHTQQVVLEPNVGAQDTDTNQLDQTLPVPDHLVEDQSTADQAQVTQDSVVVPPAVQEVPTIEIEKTKTHVNNESQPLNFRQFLEKFQYVKNPSVESANSQNDNTDPLQGIFANIAEEASFGLFEDAPNFHRRRVLFNMASGNPTTNKIVLCGKSYDLGPANYDVPLLHFDEACKEMQRGIKDTNRFRELTLDELEDFSKTLKQALKETDRYCAFCKSHNLPEPSMLQIKFLLSNGRTKILERINALNNMDTDPTQEQERDRSELVREIQQASGAAASTGAIPKHGFSHFSREKSVEEIPQPKQPQSTCLLYTSDAADE